jgi:shikimate kinase / 3-dehydroquinate synthase
MTKKNYQFSTAKVDYYFNAELGLLEKLVDKQQTVLLTDENVYEAHKKKFKGWKLIIVKPGEEHKVQSTVNDIIEQLIEFGADRGTTLVGIGGGVITDLTGYVAAIYMRGLRFGFLPTTILAMVDASVGGKNGIDVGPYKNLVGTIRQPQFLLYDLSLLKSLPVSQWTDGFAEIIKHASIKDAPMFRELEKNKLTVYRRDGKALNKLILRNASLKSDLVQRDEFEKGERRLLNFGHTLGHAIETQYDLSHGQAISIGMAAACRISEKLKRFKDTDRVVNLLKKYGLPAEASFDKKKVFEVLKMDKKRTKSSMNYILLEKIGKAVTEPIPLDKLEQLINQL